MSVHSLTLAKSLATLTGARRDGTRDRARRPDATLRALLADLVAARTAAGMTQEDVAERMRTTRSAISRLEAGKRTRPTLTTIESYARAVGAKVEISVTRR